MSKIGKLVFRVHDRIRRLQGRLIAAKAAPAGAIYTFEAKLNDGSTRPLSVYRGQVLLIVNVASECGFTPQYSGLEALYRKYKDQGLRILAFPSNEFGGQEPGTDEQIREFCRTRFSVSFDLFSKIHVRGKQAHPLYRFLTREAGHNGAIPWNFSKFLVARDGRVAERYGPHTEPTDPTLIKAVEKLLSEAA